MIDPEKLCVCGHPRSGNNYLIALLSKNFVGKSWSSIKCYHNMPFDRTWEEYEKVFYIRRNFGDVARSLYKVRQGFWIRDDVTYKEFLRASYQQLTDERGKGARFVINKMEAGVQRRRWRKRNHWIPRKENWVRFAKPYEYWLVFDVLWKLHVEKHPGTIHVVDYDMLIANFQGEMKGVGKFLGEEKEEYEDVEEKVGYFIEGDTEIG